MKQGTLVILSGFSGSGKGTLVHRLLEKYPDEYCLSVSATTRSPREGEVDGKDYFFKTNEEFERMIVNGELLEHAGYVNHYYGTPKEWVMEQLAQSKNVILEIEMQGAMAVREKFPEALLLFVTPPSAEELKARLIGRNTETEDVIMSRLARASEEADGCDAYDYLIVNDSIEESVTLIHSLISMQTYRMSRQQELIREIRNDLIDLAKGVSK